MTSTVALEHPCVVSGELDFPDTVSMLVAVRDGIDKVYITTVLGASVLSASMWGQNASWSLSI